MSLLEVVLKSAIVLFLFVGGAAERQGREEGSPAVAFAFAVAASLSGSTSFQVQIARPLRR